MVVPGARRDSNTTWSATSVPPQGKHWPCRADASAAPTWEWRLGWGRSRRWSRWRKCPRALWSTWFLRRRLHQGASQIYHSFVVLIQVCGTWTMVAGGRFRSAALQVHLGFIGVTPDVGSGNADQQDTDEPTTETGTARGCRHAFFSSAYGAFSVYPHPLPEGDGNAAVCHITTSARKSAICCMNLPHRRLCRGLLIVFEGVDGAGKTTQVRLLEQHLQRAGYHVVCLKEPTEG